LLHVLPALHEGYASLQTLRESSTRDSLVADTIQRLWDLKHIRYTTDWKVLEEDARYSRQLGWMSMSPALRGNEVEIQRRLKKKTVTILGVGGGGFPI